MVGDGNGGLGDALIEKLAVAHHAHQIGRFVAGIHWADFNVPYLFARHAFDKVIDPLTGLSRLMEIRKDNVFRK